MPTKQPQPFGPRISTWTGESHIVAVLNRGQPSDAECLTAREHFGERLAPISQEEFRPFFRMYLSHCLRAYVDPWLDSGRNPDGSEEPTRRTLAYSAKSTIWGYLNTHRPEYLPSTDPWGFSIVLDPFTNYEVVKETIFQAVENNAIRLFCALIASQWRLKVCKCRYMPCSRYFLLEKPRRAYRHGTFCHPDHRSHSSADTLTRLRRAAARAALIESAAKWLATRKVGAHWSDDVALRRELATDLSKQMSINPRLRAGRDDVRVNWVTGHQAEIEQCRRKLTRIW